MLVLPPRLFISTSCITRTPRSRPILGLSLTATLILPQTTRRQVRTAPPSTSQPSSDISNMASTTTFPPPALKQAAEEVASLLRSRNETISVAETAAGGLVSAALLATPGASRIYKGGLTLYTLESRIAFAGWTQANIDNYDGPTPDLVAGLASHVRDTLKSTYTVGESGTAGPTASGKAPNRQPWVKKCSLSYLNHNADTRAFCRGYVALAVVGDQGAQSKDLDTGLGNDRQANMVAFAVEALKLVKEYISTHADRAGKM